MSRAVTLVEVLVGLALAVLLAAAAQTLVVHVYRTGRALEAESRASIENRLPLIWLQQDLRAATTVADVQLRDGVLMLDTLNSANPHCASMRHGVRVRYSLQDRNLRRQERSSAAMTWTLEAVLASDVRRFDLAVFDGRAWNTTWPPINYRPARALRVHLEMNSGPAIDEVIPLGALQWSRHRE